MISLVVLALSVAVTIALRRRSDLALVAFCTYMAAIFTYHRPYDLVLLIPAFAFAIDLARGARGPSAWLAIAGCFRMFGLMLLAPSHPIDHRTATRGCMTGSWRSPRTCSWE